MSTTSKIRWGIVGPGKIAHGFCEDLLLVDDAEIYAVGSRSQERAQGFADKFGTSKAYGSYQEVFADPHVDIVYIATPHDSHCELSVAAMKSGKHVLCEKPIAINQRQAEQMIATSKETGRFFMEAFWSRFNPSIQAALQRVENGEIGTVRYINADFSFYVDPATAGNRMFSPENGGGTLLDMGVYPVFLAYVVLGVPNRILASGLFHEQGADVQTSMIFEYDGARAVLHSSFASQSNMMATISGEKARININPVWHETQSYSVLQNYDKREAVYRHPTKGAGFYYEVLECHKCIRKGEIESAVWSHKNSLELIGIVDEVRRTIGLSYPCE